jgi:hypothetical protein
MTLSLSPALLQPILCHSLFAKLNQLRLSGRSAVRLEQVLLSARRTIICPRLLSGFIAFCVRHPSG